MTSPPPTTAAEGCTDMTAMRPAAKIADAARAVGSLRCVSRKPVAKSCSAAMTKADTELMVAKIAIREAESAAADATTCGHAADVSHASQLGICPLDTLPRQGLQVHKPGSSCTLHALEGAGELTIDFKMYIVADMVVLRMMYKVSLLRY